MHETIDHEHVLTVTGFRSADGDVTGNQGSWTDKLIPRVQETIHDHGAVVLEPTPIVRVAINEDNGIVDVLIEETRMIGNGTIAFQRAVGKQKDEMTRAVGAGAVLHVDAGEDGALGKVLVPSGKEIILRGNEIELYKNEGYVLSIEADKIVISSITSHGLFNGVATLLQIIRLGGKDRRLPRTTIVDWPSMEVRGVSDENARGQAGSVEGLKRYCRFLGLLKINTFQMNLEDMFRSQRHPKSSDDLRGCYDKDEIREVVDHAARYFVEVTPIQTTGGHYDNVFVLPEYKHLAEFQDVAMCFDISNDEIYDYIKDIVEEEVDAWYRSPSFHMACDESWDVGKGRSREHVQRVGLGKAYLDHYTRCYRIIKNALEARHGEGNFRIYLYHDIMVHHEEVLRGLPREGLIIDYWSYTPREKYKGLLKIIEHGFDFVVSPSVMDYQRIYPSLSKSEKNIINLITYAYKEAKKRGAMDQFKGQVNTSWGDFRNENPRDGRMHGYALSAAVSWNVKDWLQFNNKKHRTFKPLQDFKKAFYLHVLGVDEEDIPLAMELDRILHDIEDGKDFRSWLGYTLLFPKLWVHPLQDVRREKSGRYPLAIKHFERGIEICDQLLEKRPDNDFHLQTARLALQLHILYCKKVFLGEKLRKITRRPAGREIVDDIVDEVVAGIEEIIRRFGEAKEAYRAAWERNCKPCCNDFLLRQYDNMMRFYGEIKDCLLRGKEFPDPFIPSEYIYLKEKVKPETPVQFRKRFFIDGKPANAWLLAFVINHGHFHLNGHLVGEVEFRNTLSFMILDNCVRSWNVTGYLKEGENELVVEVVNNVGTWPLLNCFLQVEFEGKNVEVSPREIISDGSWQVSRDGKTWNPVKTLGKTPSIIGGITRPIFKDGRPPHYTRFLGLPSEAVAILPGWSIGILAYIARKLKIIL